MTPRVYQSAGDGAWTTLFDAGEDYYRMMAAAISQSDPSVLYVSALETGSAFGGTLFRIENGDARIVGEALPRLPVSIAVDPKRRGSSGGGRPRGRRVRIRKRRRGLDVHIGQ